MVGTEQSNACIGSKSLQKTSTIWICNSNWKSVYASKQPWDDAIDMVDRVSIPPEKINHEVLLWKCRPEEDK